MGYRVLVTGSREWDDECLLDAVLRGALRDARGTVTLVHGACPKGLDRMAAAWAAREGLETDPHPARWERHGKGAGFIRNTEMVTSGADVCVAFFKAGAGNRGTAHCARLARAAGIPVISVWE